VVAVRERVKKAASAVIGLAGVYYVLQSIKFSELYITLQQTDLVAYGAGFTVLAFVLVLMGERWRWILDEKGVVVSLWEGFRQVSISMFVNSFMPLRAGDVYRGHLASDDTKDTLETSIMVMMERVLDLLVLLALTFLVVLTVYSGGLLFNYLVAGTLLLFVFAGGISLVKRVESFPVDALADVYGRFRQALLQNFRTARKSDLFGITVAIWVLGVARTFFILYALGVSPSWQLVAIVTFVWALISGIPLTPGAIGTVDAAVFVLMSEWGIPEVETVSFILLNRVMLHGLPFAVGSYFYFDENLRD
jgi:uncharacterized protein (TIRG00374 family)